MEAETGITHPYTKEHLEPPDPGRVKEGCPARAFRRSVVLSTP